MSHEGFDHLIKNLSTILTQDLIQNKKNFPYFYNEDYRIWLEQILLPDTRLVIEPNIQGSTLSIVYKDGKLAKIISKKVFSMEIILDIENLPTKIAINKDIIIKGQLYESNTALVQNKFSTNKYLMNRNSARNQLSFCCFQIINSDLNHLTQISELIKLGFQCPENRFIKYLSQVYLYIKLWREGHLFRQYPSKGIVLKVNSRKLQKQLSYNSSYANWMAFVN